MSDEDMPADEFVVQAEIDRLTGVVGILAHERNFLADLCLERLDRIEDLEAENAELRAKVAAVESLVPEWEEAIAEDERWLAGPRASVSECQELPALIRVSRALVGELRTALETKP